MMMKRTNWSPCPTRSIRNEFVCSLLFACLGMLTTNCTYGQVTWGGETQEDAYVSISNCNAESWNTYTNQWGVYVHDGYEDINEYIPEGLILIMTRIGAYEKFDMAYQKYEPCPEEPDKVCARHDVDFGFKPMSPWEWNAWKDALETHNLNNIYDFFAFCGPPGAAAPSAVATDNIAPAANFRISAEELKNRKNLVDLSSNSAFGRAKTLANPELNRTAAVHPTE